MLFASWNSEIVLFHTWTAKTPDGLAFLPPMTLFCYSLQLRNVLNESCSWRSPGGCGCGSQLGLEAQAMLASPICLHLMDLLVIKIHFNHFSLCHTFGPFSWPKTGISIGSHVIEMRKRWDGMKYHLDWARSCFNAATFPRLKEAISDVKQKQKKKKRGGYKLGGKTVAWLSLLWSTGWKKEKDIKSPTLREAACCLKRLFPAKSSFPPPHAGNSGQRMWGSPGSCGWAVPRHLPSVSTQRLCQIPPSPSPSSPPQHPARALFLIQSLWKQCHNLSGAESDICLMEMLALLWIKSNSFSQRGCKTMRRIYYTCRQSSFYYVWKHK